MTQASDLDGHADAELVALCRSGHAPAWAVLVRRYQRLVYTVPRRAGLDEAQSADVFQTCFSRLFEGLARIEDASRVQAWLVTTAKRETLRLLGLRRRESSLDAGTADGGADEPGRASPLDHLIDPDPLPDERLAQWQEADRLRRVLDRLDAPTRRLVDLLFLQDPPLAYAELSRLLDMPVGSIGPTRARCLAKLRLALQSLPDRPSGPVDRVSAAPLPPLSAGTLATGSRQRTSP